MSITAKFKGLRRCLAAHVWGSTENNVISRATKFKNDVVKIWEVFVFYVALQNFFSKPPFLIFRLKTVEANFGMPNSCFTSR